VDSGAATINTGGVADPAPTCAATSAFHSVWYSYTPATPVFATLDTIGSGYDTVLSAWTGTPGALSAVACSDDAIGLGQLSQLVLQLAAGTTYRFMVSGFSAAEAGTTVFNLNLSPYFSLAPSPASATVARGQSAQVTVTISPSPLALGFNGAVTLTCTGLPSLSTCVFNPLSPTPGAGAVTSSLSITTTAPSLQPPAPFNMRPWPAPPQLVPVLAVAMALSLLLGLLTRRGPQRRWVTLALLLATAAAGALQLACGGGGGGGPAPPPPRPGTPPGTYTVTINGNSGGLNGSSTFTLTVQ